MALATVGILSIGDMGLGIARLLIAHDYRVISNLSGRSQSTYDRAKAASVQVVDSDADLVAQSDYILSIVPPRDALSTAQRISTVLQSPSSQSRKKPLYYLDVNATSPRTARQIAKLFEPSSDRLYFLDGGIIGGPPRVKDPSGQANGLDWVRPSMPVSGPHPLSEAQPSGAHLEKTLNMKHISPEIGPASGLKMCFASLTKGLTALAIQSFTTAHRLNVLDELQAQLEQYSPKTLALAQSGLVGCPPKAYRWVKEMEEIGATFAEDGGFDEGESIFPGVSKTYNLMAYDTELGEEKTEHRKRGKTADDVAALVSEGIEKRKLKTE